MCSHIFDEDKEAIKLFRDAMSFVVVYSHWPFQIGILCLIDLRVVFCVGGVW